MSSTTSPTDLYLDLFHSGPQATMTRTLLRHLEEARSAPPVSMVWMEQRKAALDRRMADMERNIYHGRVAGQDITVYLETWNGLMAEYSQLSRWLHERRGDAS